MNKTSIEWTHRPGTTGYSWNPIRARRKDGKAATSVRDHGTFCTRISPGCKNCYASTINTRFGTGRPFEVPFLEEHEFFIDDAALQAPLKLKKPATIFVGDMFDLFHEAIPADFIAAVFAVAFVARWHTMQFLTKRMDRAHRLLALDTEYFRDRLDEHICKLTTERGCWEESWPFENVWLGTSVESQKYADERIPLLLQTPAAVRFLSVEPMLEAVTLEPWFKHVTHLEEINWVICGGESGPKARPFNLAWAESLLQQCKEAGVPFFFKQCGSSPYIQQTGVFGLEIARSGFKLKDRKGGDMSEWPEHLRVREFPA